MNTHPQLGSSGTGSGGPIPAHHPRKVAPMTTRHDSGGDKKLLRILVPINANEDSRRGVQYALRQKRAGREVEVILLHVGEPITQWQVLRFRTQQEIAQFQAERAQAFIEEASAALAAAGVPCRGLFRQGDVVFSILDTAEETECDEIAMPPPNKGLSSVFSRDLALAVRRRRRDIPVIAVSDNGIDLN